MIWNARVFDGLKQAAKEESQDAEIEQHRDKVKTWFDRVVFSFWESYAAVIARYRGASVEHSYRMLRRAQWAGPTHHHLLMVITGCVMPWVPWAPLVYVAICVVPMNLLVWSTLRFTPAPAVEPA